MTQRAVLVFLLLCISALANAQTATNSFAGLWWADEVSSAPWQIELKTAATGFTGTVRQSGGNPGPAEIFDVQINGNTIGFKARSPDNARTIDFTGERAGEEIKFKRTVTIPDGGTAGGAGLFGQGGAAEFTAKRDNARVVAAAQTAARGTTGGRGGVGRGGGAGRGAATTAATPQPAAPAGTWQITGVPFTPWILDLQVNGATLSGTVRQTGGQAGPVEITDGKVDGNVLSFRVKSPDGDRTITYRGRINNTEISFNRLVEVRPGGSHGDAGAFGTGPTAFVASRPRN